MFGGLVYKKSNEITAMMARYNFRQKMIFLIMVSALFAGLSVSGASARGQVIETTYRGIKMVGLALPQVGAYDIGLISQDTAIDKIKAALDLLYLDSPQSVAGIKALQKAGRVTIVYDATFPNRSFSSLTVAGFFPGYFQKQGKRKEFLIVVGRFGAKWPIKKLATIIVHELVGHGVQHLRGRTNIDRKIDRECEAQLYERAAQMDLKLDGTTKYLTGFRRAMQRKWCSDFRRFMYNRDPKLLDLWGFGKPNIPKLLAVFEDYIAHLRKTGVAGKAVAATKANTAAEFKKLMAKADRNRRPRDLFRVAQGFLKGKGVKKNYKQAWVWFQKAAEADYGPAYHMLGAFNEKGVAGPKNKVTAYTWYTLAAARGVKGAAKRLANLKKALSKAQIKAARKNAGDWKPVVRP